MRKPGSLAVVATAAILAVVVLLAFALFTLLQWRAFDERMHWVQHTQAVIRTMDDVESGLRDAVYGGREYLTTPTPAWYQQHHQGLLRYQHAMADLAALTSDNRQQQQLIVVARNKADSKLRLWTAYIQQRPHNSDPVWLTNAMKSMTAKEQLDDILAIRAVEQQLLSQRTAQSKLTAGQAQQWMTIGAGFSLLALSACFCALWSQVRSRLVAEQSLRELNLQLEARVAARTHDLAESNQRLSQESEALRQARDEVAHLNEQLELRVLERTRQLQASNERLQVANQDLEGFSYSVSHDLRAPLRAVVGFSRMLLDRMGTRLDAEDARLMNIVVDNASRMAELIDDLLTFSRLGRIQVARVPTDMRLLINEVLQDLLPLPGGVSVELNIDDLPRCLADRNLMRQVWSNLLANAFKFSSKRTPPRVRVSGTVEDDVCHYVITDNGAGFDMRFYEKLFGVFQRLHAIDEFPGTGVGLAIVQRVVQRHGGRVWAEGVIDQGASFHFVLPRE